MSLEVVDVASMFSLFSSNLFRLLHDSRNSYIYRGLAWSRQGTIASISKDGQSVDLRCLRAHPKDGTWGLSEPTECPLLTPTVPGCPITHLAWSTTSAPELAIIDSVGRVTILPFSLTLNHPSIGRRWDADMTEDLHSVVGCYWLPLIPQSRQVSRSTLLYHS